MSVLVSFLEPDKKCRRKRRGHRSGPHRLVFGGGGEGGLPARLHAHGLRKRCMTDMAERGCSIHEIMSVSGHLTMKEVERYTRMADRARNARAAMAGRV